MMAGLQNAFVQAACKPFRRQQGCNNQCHNGI